MENSSFGLKYVTGHSTEKSTVEDEGLGIFLACIFFSTIIVGLIGNGLVIFLAGCRMKTTVNSIWFLNLAIADFIYLLFSVTNFCLILSKQHSVFIGHILFMTTEQNVFASIWFLVVISLDRCLRTWMAVWAQNNRTLRKARIICIIIWVSSIGYISPYFPLLSLLDVEVTGTNVTYGFIMTFLIPFLIIASSYIAIGVKINRLKKRKQLKPYRLIITVILIFFICSFPQHVCWFWMARAENINWTFTGHFWVLFGFTLYLVNLNSSLNPFLYVFMCDDYKKKLKQSLVLVLETAFAEDHLDIKDMRQTQTDEQEKKTTIELLEI
ncbi:chemerin-like receptor 1 [Danio rerio]|uniref:Chemerin-like receptor 1 n=1 Tax=Danio rerio TaxID=7955 RepID=X1WH67_DANRE|nr:C3a anaphylatoxin chemotactic receptor-like [Danio rerio]|eukprot:XP_017206709.1 C3a anaphylatoxin chemotactic receptor-like [Danio rerio]